MKAHYAIHIHATVHADGIDDLLGPDGILENMPARLLEHTEVVSSGCHLQVLDEDNVEPDIDDKVQALIAYLGPDVALDLLESALQEVAPRALEISQDARDADREAGEKVIRAANGEIVRRIPAKPAFEDSNAYQDGWDGKPKAPGYDDEYDTEYAHGRRNRRLHDAGPPPLVDRTLDDPLSGPEVL